MTRRHFDTPLPPEVQFWRLRNRSPLLTPYDQARAAYEKEAKVDQWLMRMQGIRKPLRDRHAAMFRSLTTLDPEHANRIDSMKIKWDMDFALSMTFEERDTRVNHSMPFDTASAPPWVYL